MEEVVLPETWKVLSLGDILVDNSKTIDPRKFPDQYFELYSVPHFTEGKPEILKGEEIGSSKKTVEKGSVLLCKINPRINRVWIVGEFTNHRKIASTEWIAFSKIEGLFNKYLFFYLQKSALRNYLAKNVSGVGGSLMRVNKTKVSSFPFFLPPLPEQHRIVAKIEELFSELDNGIANLEKAKAQLKVYRQAVLKSAFEGKLTEQWRSGQMAATEGSPVPNNHEVGTGTLPSAEDLLARIQEERQNHYEQQLTEWREAVAEWEANGKEGRKPSKPKKPTEYPPLTEKELGELSELPVGWCYSTLGHLKEFSIYGPRFSSKDYTDKGVAVLRTSDISDFGKVDLINSPKLPLSEEDYEKYKLIIGDLLITRTGSIGRVSVFNDTVKAIPGAFLIHYRLIPYISSWFIFYYLKSSKAQRHLTSKSAGIGRPNLNVPSIEQLKIPIPSQAEQLKVIFELEAKLSVCDHMEQEIEKALQKSEALRQSILKKAFEGRLVPQDPNDEPAGELLKRIKGEKGQGKQMEFFDK